MRSNHDYDARKTGESHSTERRYGRTDYIVCGKGGLVVLAFITRAAICGPILEFVYKRKAFKNLNLLLG